MIKNSAAALVWSGISGRNSYTELLRQCGFRYQRLAKVYKSHNQEKVAAFDELVEKKVVDNAQDAPDTVYLAEDEASLQVY